MLFSVNNEFEVVLQVWISSCWWDVYEGFEDLNQYGVSTTASPLQTSTKPIDSAA